MCAPLLFSVLRAVSPSRVAARGVSSRRIEESGTRVSSRLELPPPPRAASAPVLLHSWPCFADQAVLVVESLAATTNKKKEGKAVQLER